MFVGIVGPTCSGKHELMTLLASVYGFTRLYLRSTTYSSTSSASRSGGGSIREVSGRGDTARHTNGHGKAHRDRKGKEFDTIEAMLDYVTLNWMRHFVTCDVLTVQGIAVLRKRPFFLLLSVESPMMVRYRRCVARCQGQGDVAPTLEEFVEKTDASLYNAPLHISKHATSPPSHPEPSRELEHSMDGLDEISPAVASSPEEGLSPSIFQPLSVASRLLSNSQPYKLMSMSDLSILNSYADIESLQESLEALDITNPDLLRPSWDSYFMYLANLAARRSNCMKRRVGCVLVREKRVIATGYNGTPKNLTNCNDGGCSRCNQATPCGRGLDRCLCMHAEENALLEAGRERVGNGSTIYCNTCPCLGCAIKIVQVGISQVVYSESYGMDDLTAEVFRKAGVELRQHATPGIKLDQSNP